MQMQAWSDRAAIFSSCDADALCSEQHCRTWHLYVAPAQLVLAKAASDRLYVHFSMLISLLVGILCSHAP